MTNGTGNGGSDLATEVAELRARVASRTEKPWWAPDAQGFLAASIIAITGAALFMRMNNASTIDDKMLDTMITILFSTCLVTVFQFTFGSSRGQQTSTETQNKVVEKLTATAPAGPPGPVAPIPAPVVVIPWWSLLTDAERSAISTAAPTDPKAASFQAAAQTGKATADDLAYLVSKDLLTQARADAIKGA